MGWTAAFLRSEQAPRSEGSRHELLPGGNNYAPHRYHGYHDGDTRMLTGGRRSRGRQPRPSR